MSYKNIVNFLTSSQEPQLKLHALTFGVSSNQLSVKLYSCINHTDILGPCAWFSCVFQVDYCAEFLSHILHTLIELLGDFLSYVLYFKGFSGCKVTFVTVVNS